MSLGLLQYVMGAVLREFFFIWQHSRKEELGKMTSFDTLSFVNSLELRDFIEVYGQSLVAIFILDDTKPTSVERGAPSTNESW